MTRLDLHGEVPLPACDQSSVLRVSGASTIALPAPNGESAARTHRTHAIHFNLKCLGTPTTEFDSSDVPCNLRNNSRFAFRSARMDIEKWRFPGAPQKESSGPSYTQNRTGMAGSI